MEDFGARLIVGNRPWRGVTACRAKQPDDLSPRATAVNGGRLDALHWRRACECWTWRRIIVVVRGDDPARGAAARLHRAAAKSRVSTTDQLAPSQMNQPIPPAVSEPPSASHPAAHAAASATAEPPAAQRWLAHCRRMQWSVRAGLRHARLGHGLRQQQRDLRARKGAGHRGRSNSRVSEGPQAAARSMVEQSEPYRPFSDRHRWEIDLDRTGGPASWPDLAGPRKAQSQAVQAQGFRQGRRGHGQRLGRRRARHAARRLQGQRELSRRCEDRQGCGERDRGGPRIQFFG